MINLADDAMTIKLDYELPEYPKFEEGYRRAPRRESHLSEADKALAIKNALRYIHPDHHEQMAKEFAQELEEHGRIYGYRFRPEGKLYGKPIDEYKGKCIEGKAIQVMIDNNLDFDIALYPYELVTYGETGQVCQNWMQYRLIKKYLEQLTDEQTLVVMSGHPLGLFHSHKMAPRVIISNGLMVGTFDDQENFNRAAALGVANYGQMTAGGWMYIGPQGIVHGTFNTLLNAGRLKLGIPNDKNLAGRLFVSAGLGGMSGAQGKAAEMPALPPSSPRSTIPVSRPVTPRAGSATAPTPSKRPPRSLSTTRRKASPALSPTAATLSTCSSTCTTTTSMST